MNCERNLKDCCLFTDTFGESGTVKEHDNSRLIIRAMICIMQIHAGRHHMHKPFAIVDVQT